MNSRLRVALLLLCVCVSAASARALDAYIWEPSNTTVTALRGLTQSLTEAGFTVQPLPKDKSPTDLKADLIVFGSFASFDPDYAAYLKKYAENLRQFAEQGGVLLQLAQKEESQISQPFLPADLRASRGDFASADLRVTAPMHPLTAGLAAADGRIDLPTHLQLSPGWHTFMEQQGCAVLIGAGEGIDDPVLLEAPVGQGRILLASLFFDRLRDEQGKLAAPPAYEKFAQKFSANLAAYVRAVRENKAPAVQAAPKPVPLPFVPGSWTIAVLPDTQYYSQKYPDVFESQTKWIAAHVAENNIRYVLHLGDITNDNKEPTWVNARRAMSHLDGKVPYAIVAGNHDYGPGGNSADRTSFFNQYFPLAQYQDWPTFGGAMEPGKMDNTWHHFEAGGKKWLILALEWAPRDEVVTWANGILKDHPDHLGILITHAYMSSDDRRFDRDAFGKQSASPHNYALEQHGGVNDGGDLWRKLVSLHPNMVMTINGHTLQDGVARLSSEGVHGNVVHQMLANYQRMRPTNGNGFLRLYEFLPDGRTIQVRTYSPYWDIYKTDSQNQFTLTIQPPTK